LQLCKALLEDSAVEHNQVHPQLYRPPGTPATGSQQVAGQHQTLFVLCAYRPGCDRLRGQIQGARCMLALLVFTRFTQRQGAQLLYTDSCGCCLCVSRMCLAGHQWAWWRRNCFSCRRAGPYRYQHHLQQQHSSQWWCSVCVWSHEQGQCCGRPLHVRQVHPDKQQGRKQGGQEFTQRCTTHSCVPWTRCTAAVSIVWRTLHCQQQHLTRLHSDFLPLCSDLTLHAAAAQAASMDRGGGGLMATGNIEVQLTGSTAEGNTATSGPGGALHCLQCNSLSLHDCSMRSNGASGPGGGACCEKCAHVSVKSTATQHNTATAGAGLYVSLTAAAAGAQRVKEQSGVFESSFHNNTAASSAVAAAAEDTGASADEQDAVGAGGAVLVKSPVPFTVSGSKFTSNYAASGHGGGCISVLVPSCKGS
jgi:hypothetical protein